MTSKSGRKSLVASFGLISAELENRSSDETPVSSQQAPAPSSPRVGAGVIGAAHRVIEDIKTERDRFKALVEAGDGAIKELDPSKIDSSPYPDRLPDDDLTSFESFRNSIKMEGQKVPIQVRKSPTSTDRYQVIFGHRRWQAAKDLGIPVKAIEVDISDLELVIAQGIENGQRQDLTWIERAVFARRMDEAEIRPRDIYKALSIGDAELARMRAVYRAVPMEIIEAVGRTPKIGRPRWIEFAKVFSENPERLEDLKNALSWATEKRQRSDQKFLIALSALKSAVPSAKTATVITDEGGNSLASYVATSKNIRITSATSTGAEFLKFIEAELPTLAARFSSENSKI